MPRNLQYGSMRGAILCPDLLKNTAGNASTVSGQALGRLHTFRRGPTSRLAPDPLIATVRSAPAHP